MDNKKSAKIFSVGIMLVGIIAIVFAVLCCSPDIYIEWGGLERDQYYGGDAYTGIQQAAAETANNVRILNSNIDQLASFLSSFAGYLLFIIGLVLLVVGISKMITSFAKEKKSADIIQEQEQSA